MTAYATVADVEAGFRELSADEKLVCLRLLMEVGVRIDAYAAGASSDVKKVVSCQAVRRALANSGASLYPLGATQGSMTAGSYQQSFTVSGGGVGEIYFTAQEKRMLGGNRIGARSPLEDMAPEAVS